MAELYYDVRWSGDCDERFIDDFNSVQDQVFKGVHDRRTFKHQYIDNIYGPSVIVVVYDENKPVAARALWRNDVNDKLAYQTGRVCVLPEYRGQGIFRQMTEKSVAILPKEAITYSYPNHYSFPGYEKMGWVLLHERYLRLFISKKAYSKEHSIAIDRKYYEWWVKEKRNLCIKRRGEYYLVKRIKPCCYEIISKVDLSIAKDCTIVRGLVIVFYLSTMKRFYGRYIMPSRTVAKNISGISYIPKWKIDAI